MTALQTNTPIAAESPGRRRFLMLVHRVPYPPDKGDRIRSYHLLAHLARLGEVDLAFPTDGPLDGPTRQELERLCRRVAVVSTSSAGRWARAFANLARGRSLTEGLFDAPKLRREVGRWLDETPYDAVVCFSSGVLPYVRGRGLEDRLVVDLVDADSQKFFDYAERTSWPKAALLRLEGHRVRALEREAGKARAVVLATEAEANLYRGICPEAPTSAVPNGVNLEYFRPMPEVEESAGCVFVGQLDYRANVLGLEWFCQEAWPLIREALPGATFRIVGRAPVPAVQKLGDLPGVEVVGTVPDVRPYVAEARVAVVPLPVARGVQNKVLEAMAMGKAVVASPSALEGLGVTPGRDALAAATPDEWRRHLVGLWDDADRRGELGRAARQYVEAHHRWETCLAPFGDFVVISSRPS